MRRSEIIKVIKSLPPDVDIDQLFEKIVVLQKIEEGLEDFNNGKLVSHEKVKRDFLKKWSK